MDPRQSTPNPSFKSLAKILNYPMLSFPPPPPLTCFCFFFASPLCLVFCLNPCVF
ncbi:hypothetical protein BDV40DRAFT_254566 [Aspergillus tamarii]|uniref:Uncharacterized protein n=1 Tax=Aspergillus tamarii TaxID=41984 RepID=A0A5N6V827_ASPTM|nr:hypothetical protein BDV40DRAFT_254566 [Aspergillus tamarii]